MNEFEHTQNPKLWKSAGEAYAKHEIAERSEDGRMYLIRKPDGGEYYARVFLYDGQITVVGDCDPVTFSYYSDTRDPIKMLRWMSRADGPGVYYVDQKASIGSGKRVSETRTREAWKADALAWWRQYRKDEGLRRRPEWFADALQHAEDEMFDVAEWTIYTHANTDGIGICGWGVRKAPRVYYAWHALRRLDTLLSLERGEPTPDEEEAAQKAREAARRAPRQNAGARTSA